MTSPKLYLAIDNCFAGKRWTAPGGMGARRCRAWAFLRGSQRGYRA